MMLPMTLVWLDKPPMRCSVKDLYGPQRIPYARRRGKTAMRSQSATGAWRQKIGDWWHELVASQADACEGMATNESGRLAEASSS